MSTIYKNTLNTGNLQNFGQPKIIKSYDDIPKESVAEQTHDVIFDKPDQVLTFDVPQTDTEVPETQDNAGQAPVLTDKQIRDERRASFKRAADAERRAMEMQKQAKEKLSKAEEMKQLLEQAKKDPTAVARALNMDPTEFLRQYQNAMFNIPTTTVAPPLSKEEEMQQRIERYDAERRAEKEAFMKWQADTNKSNYINFKILPIITANPDKFELLNIKGKEECAALLYDVLNAAYQKTGKELDPMAAAEEMENQLTEMMEYQINETKKLKKAAKHFRFDTDAPGQQITFPGNLGEGQDLSAPEPLSQPTTQGVKVSQSAMEAQRQANLASDVVKGDTSLNTRQVQGPPVTRKGSPVQHFTPAAEQVVQKQNTFLSKKEQKLRKVEDYAKANKITRNF